MLRSLSALPRISPLRPGRRRSSRLNRRKVGSVRDLRCNSRKEGGVATWAAIFQPDDPTFDQKVTEMLGAFEKDSTERTARAQALTANSVLALMGLLNFSKLSPELREQRHREVFELSCYALAGMPVVQSTLAAEYGFSEGQAVAAVVRTLGLIFDRSEPLIKKMLGGDGPPGADISAV